MEFVYRCVSEPLWLLLYKENLDAVDARIKEMQQENKGLIQKAVDAIVGVIKTIIELTQLLLQVLQRVASAIGNILKEPIGFLSNLFNALQQSSSILLRTSAST
ncbi:MAG UNVERIFIED_CONTAM: hypothetical protein LVR29_04880 [Microcystis novacekii LVE1205-3]|jgi:phage-related protein